MPLTVADTRYNVANLRARRSQPRVSIAPGHVAEVCALSARFRRQRRALDAFRRTVCVVLDYVNLPARAVLQVALALRGPGGRMALLLGHRAIAATRTTRISLQCGGICARLVVVMKMKHRAGARREVPALLLQHCAPGVPETALSMVYGIEAARHALAPARPVT
jgi:hypothetical protein